MTSLRDEASMEIDHWAGEEESEEPNHLELEPGSAWGVTGVLSLP